MKSRLRRKPSSTALELTLKTDTSTPEKEELLAEAMFKLSARLRASGFLDNEENHQAYEAVVAAFNAPAGTPRLGETGDDDVVERVARALYAAAHLRGPNSVGAFEKERAYFDGLARAALQQVQPLIERVKERCALAAAMQRHQRAAGVDGCETLVDAYSNGCVDAAAAIRQVDVGGEGG